MSREQFERLLDVVRFPVEQRVLWSALWHGELWLGELTDGLVLEVGNVSIEERTATVMKPVKGPGPRVVPLSTRTAALFREVMAGRKSRPLLTDGGRPVSRAAADKWAHRAGVSSIHDLRRGGLIARGERPTEE